MFCVCLFFQNKCCYLSVHLNWKPWKRKNTLFQFLGSYMIPHDAKPKPILLGVEVGSLLSHNKPHEPAMVSRRVHCILDLFFMSGTLFFCQRVFHSRLHFVVCVSDIKFQCMGMWEDKHGNIWAGLLDTGENIPRARFKCLVSKTWMEITIMELWIVTINMDGGGSGVGWWWAFGQMIKAVIEYTY